MKLSNWGIAVALSLIGSLAAPQFAQAADTDQDGVPDSSDQCPNTTGLGASVFIGPCDTRVANTVDPVGCSIAERIADCLAIASTNKQFRDCVQSLTSELVRAGVITGKARVQIGNVRRSLTLLISSSNSSSNSSNSCNSDLDEVGFSSWIFAKGRSKLIANIFCPQLRLTLFG